MGSTCWPLLDIKVIQLCNEKSRSKAEIAKLMKKLDKIAAENAKYTKGFDSVKALREIRYQDQ